MRPNVADIIREAAEQAGLTVDEILGRFQDHGRARVRLRAYWAARVLRPDLSWPALGRAFSRHHASVLHGVRSHSEAIAADPLEHRATAALVGAFTGGVRALTEVDRKLIAAALAGRDLGAAADFAGVSGPVAAMRLAKVAAAINGMVHGGRDGQAA